MGNNKFLVFDISEVSSKTMTYEELCEVYGTNKMLVLKSNNINIISIWEKGVKVAVVSRVREEISK